MGAPKLKSRMDQMLLIEKLQRSVDTLKLREYEIIQVDECLFNSDHFKGKHWAPKAQPFKVIKRFLNQPKIVVMGSISVEKGNVFYKYGEFSFSTADTIDFLC
jgi:hypothetical protein